MLQPVPQQIWNDLAGDDSGVLVANTQKPSPKRHRPRESSIWAQSSIFLPFYDAGNGAVNLAVAIGLGTLSFSRATVASCRMNNGLMAKVASGVARSHYIASGVYAGYYAEEARTNVVFPSEDLATTWVANAGTLTPNDRVALDGAFTADLFTENGANSTHFMSLGVGTAPAAGGESWVASVFVRPAGRSEFRIQFGGTGFANEGVTFNTNTLTVTPDGGGQSGAIEVWGSGWFRLVARTTSTAAGTNALNIMLVNGGASSYQGNGSSGAHIWGAQEEQSVTFESSYIPTVGGSVTRNADVLSYTSPIGFNQAQGTIYCEVTPTMGAVAGNRYALSFDDGTTNNDIALLLTATLAGAAQIRRAAALEGQVTLNGGAMVPGTGYKTVLGYSAPGSSATKNNNLIATIGAVTLPPAPTQISVGHDGSGAQQMFGCIENIRVWQTRLSDDLIRLIST